MGGLENAKNKQKIFKLRELRLVFDALDEHDDGEISRDELLAALDLDHPHLMAMLKASPAAISTDGKGGMAADAATTSVLDVLVANDEEFVFWEEVRVSGRSDRRDSPAKVERRNGHPMGKK